MVAFRRMPTNILLKALVLLYLIDGLPLVADRYSTSGRRESLLLVGVLQAAGALIHVIRRVYVRGVDVHY